MSIREIGRIDRYKRTEKVRFLREVARDLYRDDVSQAIMVTRLADGSIGWESLNKNGYSDEMLLMLERAKLEMFADRREVRNR